VKPRIIFIHGNGAEHWNFAFSGWLKKKLEERGYPTFFETFPDSIMARSSYWLPFLKNQVKAGENDVIIGWSSGAVAAMRYTENNKIAGSILICPCYTDLGEESEKISGYYDSPWNWEKIKNNQKNIALFYSDNDPFIPINEPEYIAKKLGAEKFMLPGRKHFIEQNKITELLEYITRTYL
jgi:predicted alpha/beta hydrolase family esterase